MWVFFFFPRAPYSLRPPRPPERKLLTPPPTTTPRPPGPPQTSKFNSFRHFDGPADPLVGWIYGAGVSPFARFAFRTFPRHRGVMGRLLDPRGVGIALVAGLREKTCCLPRRCVPEGSSFTLPRRLPFAPRRDRFFFFVVLEASRPVRPPKLTSSVA